MGLSLSAETRSVLFFLPIFLFLLYLYHTENSCSGVSPIRWINSFRATVPIRPSRLGIEEKKFGRVAGGLIFGFSHLHATRWFAAGWTVTVLLSSCCYCGCWASNSTSTWLNSSRCDCLSPLGINEIVPSWLLLSTHNHHHVLSVSLSFHGWMGRLTNTRRISINIFASGIPNFGPINSRIKSRSRIGLRSPAHRCVLTDRQLRWRSEWFLVGEEPRQRRQIVSSGKLIFPRPLDSGQPNPNVLAWTWHLHLVPQNVDSFDGVYNSQEQHLSLCKVCQ